MTLAAAAVRHRDTADILREYDAQRRPRSRSVARTAERVGRFGQRLANPVAVALRNAAVRLTPARVAARATVRLADWTPPRIP